MRFHVLASRYTIYPHLWGVFHFQASRPSDYPLSRSVIRNLSSLLTIYPDFSVKFSFPIATVNQLSKHLGDFCSNSWSEFGVSHNLQKAN